MGRETRSSETFLVTTFETKPAISMPEHTPMRPRVNLRLKGITNHGGQRTAASASAGGGDAVDRARPGLEVHARAQVRLDLGVEADQLFAQEAEAEKRRRAWSPSLAQYDDGDVSAP